MSAVNWDEFKKVASWGRYVHWAKLNGDHWICADEHTPSESIALSFQFFASMYVAIEGWEQLNLKDPQIENILQNNKQGILLLKRARNAVYHFQKQIFSEKMLDFADEFGRESWVVDLYYEFVRFLGEYPTMVYPFDDGKDEFIADFYKILGWEPEFE